ncbi:MAG TPA: glycosyltransferase family 2 protein [Bacilli bacterium]
MPKTLIVIPAYNEEAGLGSVLEKLREFQNIADILVVNDGSNDQTLEVARRFAVFIVSHPINLGYGAALQTGYRFAFAHGYDYVVHFDGDGQHHPDDLRQLIHELWKDTADIVTGSRILGESRFTLGLRKSIAFLWFTTIIRLFTGIKVTDPTSGLRGLSRRAFSYCAFSTSFPHDFPDADMIIHMHYQGFKMREFPIRSQKREQGKSMHSGSIRHAIYMLKVTMGIINMMVFHLLFERRKG